MGFGWWVVAACTAPGDDARSSGETGGSATSGDTAVGPHTGGPAHSGGLFHSGAPGHHSGGPPLPEGCDSLPPGPVETTPISLSTSEDFDFDDLGHLCTIDPSTGSLVGRTIDGITTVLAPTVTTTGSTGTRFLPTGDFVVNNPNTGTLILIDSNTGGHSVVYSGMVGPNGLEVGDDHYVYVTTQTEVRQIDPYTGEGWIVTDELPMPNGLIFDPQGSSLFVGALGAPAVFRIDRLGEHEWEEPVLVAENSLTGFDGVNADACGNLYLTGYAVGSVFRSSPDGSVIDVLYQDPVAWLPNLRWGSGVGGWRRDVLYVSEVWQVRALETGVEGKPRPRW